MGKQLSMFGTTYSCTQDLEVTFRDTFVAQSNPTKSRPSTLWPTILYLLNKQFNFHGEAVEYVWHHLLTHSRSLSDILLLS